MKRKICVVVTARPSYSRIKTALLAMKAHPNIELQIVAAASAVLEKYGKVIDIMEKDGFSVTQKVFTVLEGENLLTSAKSTGVGIVELATVFDAMQPDMIVTIADRFETMATAITAAYMNIPLVHIQGGEVTGSIDEKVRHAITKLANIHLVSTEEAKTRVVRMGEPEDKVIVTGCPSIDLASGPLSLDFNPFEKYGGVGKSFSYTEGYVVALQHPVTTEYDQARAQVRETLMALNELAHPVFWFWPNVDAGADGTSGAIRTFREKNKPELMHFFKNMDPEDFLKLIANARCVVGNSSVGIRECSFLGIPVVNLGSRQQGRLRGHNVKDVAHEKEQIVKALQEQWLQGKYPSENIYGDGNAGERIANILASIPLDIEKKLTY